MGIRFNCPNGHKLNVKADLAGRRAICPECGAKLVVPGTLVTRVNEPAMSSAIGLPLAMPSGIAVQRSTPVSAEVVPPVTRSGAVWYVRPRGGGQYGPATDEVFRSWILEGRVEDDAHVWREGWSDWKLAREAGAVLPAPLTPIPEVAAPEVIRPAPDTAVAAVAIEVPAAAEAVEAVEVDEGVLPAVGDEAMLPATRYLANRQRANKLQISIALLMLVAIIVLGAVLVWVLMRNETPASTTTTALPVELAKPVTGAYVAGETRTSGFPA